MSKHNVPAGDICVLLARFSEIRERAFARTGKSFPVIVIQKAGLGSQATKDIWKEWASTAECTNAQARNLACGSFSCVVSARSNRSRSRMA